MFLFVFFFQGVFAGLFSFMFSFPIAEFSASLPEFFLFCWFLACESIKKNQSLLKFHFPIESMSISSR